LKISRREKGITGEEKAVKFLIKNGYKIKERNWRFKKGEIDIIAFDKKGVLCFIEVRSKKENSLVLPEETITITKQRHILKVAKAYLLKLEKSVDVRFDVVSVSGNSINLIKDAFRS